MSYNEYLVYDVSVDLYYCLTGFHYIQLIAPEGRTFEFVKNMSEAKILYVDRKQDWIFFN